MHGGVCCYHVTVCDFAMLCIAALIMISLSVRSDTAMHYITTSIAAVNPLN